MEGRVEEERGGCGGVRESGLEWSASVGGGVGGGGGGGRVEEDSGSSGGRE